VLLYLLDRSQQRRVVATLRFWRNALTPMESRRWRIRQPLSLFLQLLSIALLLLAVAQLRFGGSANESRDHVLVLDTSAWMGARGQDGTLMDEARQRALDYVRALPAADRVMVLRAGPVETPVTSFEEKRPIIEDAINGSEPEAGGADLAAVLRRARRVRELHGRRAGEVVYIGPGRTAGREEAEAFGNLRYIGVGGATQNVGLRRVGLRQAAESGNTWEVYVAVRNDGEAPRPVEVSVQFASAPAAFERFELPASGDAEFAFPLRTTAAGILEVQVFAEDDFPDDNYVALEIPARHPVRMAAYTREPELLRPLVEASPMVEAEFFRPGAPMADDADVVVLDRCEPASPPVSSSIWIAPPSASSPVKEAGAVRGVKLTRWSSDHALGAGLRTRDVELEHTILFEPTAEDTVIAESGSGPVIVARGPAGAGAARTVVLGFHPMQGEMRYELATPLLFANIVRWMKPGVFRTWELNTGSVGTVSAPLGDDVDRASVRVVDEQGESLPFALEDGSVHFYAGRAGIVRLYAGNREIVYSLNLPAVPEGSWEPPDSVLRGVPGAAPAAGAADIWQWLAIAGILGLAIEWLLYGRFRRRPAEDQLAGLWRRAA